MAIHDQITSDLSYDFFVCLLIDLINKSIFAYFDNLLLIQPMR